MEIEGLVCLLKTIIALTGHSLAYQFEGPLSGPSRAKVTPTDNFPLFHFKTSSNKDI